MNRKGFTLIEVMIVMLILGIIAMIAIPIIAEEGDKAKAEIVEAVTEAPAPKVAEVPVTKETTTTTDVLTSTIYEVAILRSVEGERPTLKEIWPVVGSRTGAALKGWLDGDSNIALVSIDNVTYVVNYDQSVGIVVSIEEF
ncbi:MAG: prepilin-type N-terminal cleavage/methylation domain-containing protein [Anaerolineales bacterium]|nr:prepilin-type N-terminal cleavage/methylation domain-containing protein [Anaerolineales bacterium]